MEGFKMANYGQKREVNATDGELAIYRYILDVAAEAGIDPDLFELCRVSNSYVSVVIGRNDVARFKWSERTAWIKLPYGDRRKEQRPLESIADLDQYKTEILGHCFMALGFYLIYGE